MTHSPPQHIKRNINILSALSFYASSWKQIPRLLSQFNRNLFLAHIMSGTTLSISSLNALLKSLHHDETIPHIQDALVLSNILDLYKSFICKNLAQANGLSPEAIFHSLDRPQTLDQGDLVLPIPRLRVKGANTSELGNEWARKVINFFSFKAASC